MDHARPLRKRNSSLKESSFLAEMLLLKSLGVAYWQSPMIPRKFVALYHRNNNIRIRFDKHD